MENDVTYWRNRAEFYQRQTVEMEARIDSMEEVAGAKNAVIASLRSRLKELEERMSAVETAGMAIRNTDSGPNLVNL